jgi:hypothetical protein
MRQPFQSQPELQITPIEKIRLPLKRRDELPADRWRGAGVAVAGGHALDA